MSAIDSSDFPVVAPPSAQRPAKTRNSLRDALRTMRGNSETAHPPEHYTADIIEQRILWRRMFVINEPGAIRYMLLDNAANYTKIEVGRRVLEPGLGRGLLTSEGETWRRHRRIMAPLVRSAQRRRLCADHDRGDAGAAGESGTRCRKEANSMSPRR